MRKRVFMLAAGLLFPMIAGCGTGGVVIDPDKANEAIATPDQMGDIIKNLKSNQTFGQRFAVGQCEKLGPQAAEALPALKELRAKTPDAEFQTRIDSVIAVVEGTAPIPGPAQ